MNKELEEAKKKLHDSVVAYIRAAYKLCGGEATIAALMLAKELGNLSESLTEEDFAGLEDEEKKAEVNDGK